MKENINITLDEELIKKIDKLRNDIPRSTYINKLIKKALKGG